MKATWKVLAAAVFLACTAYPFESFGQLTAEDVEAVMEDPYIQDALANCVKGERHPEEMDLIMIINKKGKAALAFTEPEVAAETFACMQKVIKTVSFPATGNKFEITYPVEFPPFEGSGGTQPAPAEGTETPTEAAAPAETPELGQPRRTTIQPEGTYKPAQTTGDRPSASTEFWTRELKKSKIFMGVGGMMMGLGIGAMAGSFVYYYMKTDGSSSKAGTTEKLVLLVGLIGGLALTYGGIHLFILGKKRLEKSRSVLDREYGGLVPAVAIFPAVDAGGATAALTWRF